MRGGRVLLCALLALIACGAQAQYVVTKTGDTFSITSAGSEVWAASAISGTSVFSGNVEVTNVTVSRSDVETVVRPALALLSNNFTASWQLGTVVKLSSRTYRIHIPSDSASVVYFISPNLFCNASTLVGDDSFVCSDYSTASVVDMVMFTPTASLVSTSGPYRVAFTTLASVSNTDRNEMVTIAVTKLLWQSKFMTGVAFIAAAYDTKSADAKLVIGFIFFFVAVAMTLSALVVATWQTWCFPGFKKFPVLWWSVLLVVGIHTVSWAGGLGGWIAVMCLLAVYAVALPIVYLVTWRRRMKLANKVQDSAIELAPIKAAKEETTPPPKSRCGWPTIHWAQRPEPLGRRQRQLLIGFSASAIAMVLLCVFIFVGWDEKDYHIWDRNRAYVVGEFTPVYVSKAASSIYAFPRLASTLRFDWFFQTQTQICGTLYSTILTSDSDKQNKIQKSFVDKYTIDMNIFERPLYSQYESVNDWFSRKLATGVRPISGPNNPRILTSSADCRLTVFANMDADLQVWLKGDPFTVETLLTPDLARDFIGGSMAILRLAPADYHRCHAPMTGTVLAHVEVPSTIYSVNAEAIRSQNGAVYNHRIIQILSDGQGRKVAYVAIGAQCVGSIVMGKKAGDSFVKGDDFSYFQFGGSTVVQVFPPNMLDFDSDLLAASRQATEVLVQMGQHLGKWRS